MKFKQYELKNGLPVVLSPFHETNAVTAMVLVKVGSRYEQRRINGTSHFVEHLLFKGTKKRPTALHLTRELDSIGAEYNAFTSKDHTGYYIKASHDKIELLLDVLSDMVFRSTFNPKEIEKERGVIVEEINMYEDNPIMQIEDIFEETMFGDIPLGWNIAGPREVIRSVSRADLVKYYRHYYRPRNMLIGIAGKLDDGIERLVARYFSVTLPTTRFSTFRPVTGKQTTPHVSVKEKKTEQVQLALGFPAYSYFTPKLYPLYLLSNILGGNMSSRLFMSIREKRGLCYFIRTGVNVYEDTGAFVVQAGLDKTRVDGAITAIISELAKVVRSGVTATELTRSKEYIKGKLTMDLEASDSVASWLTRQLLLQRRILTPEQQIKKLEAVTLDDIRRVAKELLRPDRMNLALIGPFTDEGRFRRLLKMPAL